MPEMLQISMLGGFSLGLGENRIDDSSNRMKRVWLLLAYLIYTRRSRLTQDHYLTLLQESNGEFDDPSGRLKALFYRVRSMLDQLGDGTGHRLIVRRDGTYAWNTDVPLVLDVEEFDRLCSEALRQEGDERLATLLQALELYRGDFLPKLSMDPWVMPVSTYFHQRYLDAAGDALKLLAERGRWSEVVSCCSRALKIEPYSEELYQYLMRGQIATGDRGAAVAAYETMSQVLFDTFGVMPSDDSRRLYREASKEQGESYCASSESVREHLQEPGSINGAVFCEYDFFRLLYQVQARAIVRSGDVIHIALMSLRSTDGTALPRRSLDRAMENLQSLVVSGLRQGDVVTRYSASQLILMLPQANYENSCAVCKRLVKAFCRQYPHSPAQVHFTVHPLEPSLPAPHGN